MDIREHVKTHVLEPGGAIQRGRPPAYIDIRLLQAPRLLQILNQPIPCPPGSWRATSQLPE
jgi:hypothetical protein